MFPSEQLTPLQHNMLLMRVGIMRVPRPTAITDWAAITLWLVHKGYMKRDLDPDNEWEYRPTFKGRFYLYQARRRACRHR